MTFRVVVKYNDGQQDAIFEGVPYINEPDQGLNNYLRSNIDWSVVDSFHVDREAE